MICNDPESVQMAYRFPLFESDEANDYSTDKYLISFPFKIS